MPATTADTVQIRLPDGTVKAFEPPVTGLSIAASIGEGLAKAAIGVKVDDELLDVNRIIAPLPGGEPRDIAIITRPREDKQGRSRFRDADHERDALYLLRHSCAHVMAEAILRLWPDAQLAYGPPLDTGYYYDIALDQPISSDDFKRIEAEIKHIVEENRPFSRYELACDAGIQRLEAEGNKYKVDNAQRAISGGAERLSWYVTGEAPGGLGAKGLRGLVQEEVPQEHAASQSPPSAAERLSPSAPSPTPFEDLCQGPHLPRTGDIGGFKVMSVASSHWHGDVTSDRFQRVYGTAFFTQADLDAHLEQLDQARQRDHRVVGQRLGLFTIDEQVGQGLILWKPKGAIVREELQRFITEHLKRQGYSMVFTPHIGKIDLYRTSGHFPYYKESQYPPMVEPDQMTTMASEGCACAEISNRLERNELSGYLLKPMNCPHHIKIYDSEKRSYRDLPIRLSEFGTVYRWEQSGELSGMTRVRGFTQDDAHLFVREDQLDAEVAGCLELVKIVFKTLGMDDYRVRVGLRDPDEKKFVGDAKRWDQAEAACQNAAATLGVPFSAEPGEAAFYGPKIDFVVRDVIGREWQLGTVQVDYVLPERFDLWYTGSDNQPHRPVMIHRAPFGSMERFVGVLIEHFNGAFPLWLSPEQVRVLPISDRFLDYAKTVSDTVSAAGLRVSVDDGNDRLNAKIKVAQEEKIPYMLVVGGKDETAGTVSVRHRSKGDRGAVTLADFVAAAKGEAETRDLGEA